MANYKTGAQRYNDRMEKIFSNYRKQEEANKLAHPWCKCEHLCHSSVICPSEIPW